MTRREKIEWRKATRTSREFREACRLAVPSKRQSKAIGKAIGQKWLKVFPVIRSLGHI